MGAEACHWNIASSPRWALPRPVPLMLLQSTLYELALTEAMGFKMTSKAMAMVGAGWVEAGLLL